MFAQCSGILDHVLTAAHFENTMHVIGTYSASADSQGNDTMFFTRLEL